MADAIIDPDEAAAKLAQRKAYQAKQYLKNREERKAKSRAHYAANKERINEQKKVYGPKWVAANPDKVRAKMTKWREANRDIARAANRKWRAENPESAKAAAEKWASHNPEKIKATKANRRTRELEAVGEFTASDIKTLFRRQRGRCAYHDHCGASIKGGYHVDHITPLARGGTNWPKNLQLTCANCNNRKHAKHPIDFAQELGRLL